jgi:hypothetical protein
MEAEGSVPCLQKPSTIPSPHPEPDPVNFTPIYVSKNQF